MFHSMRRLTMQISLALLLGAHCLPAQAQGITAGAAYSKFREITQPYNWRGNIGLNVNGIRNGLPPASMDSFVYEAKENAFFIYGDEGTDGLPPLDGFEPGNRINAGIYGRRNEGLTTGHGSYLPDAWGGDEWTGNEWSQSGAVGVAAPANWLNIPLGDWGSIGVGANGVSVGSNDGSVGIGLGGRQGVSGNVGGMGIGNGSVPGASGVSVGGINMGAGF